MINISINLTNPLSRRFKCYSKTIKVSKHKTLELELSKNNCIISVFFRWAIRESHAGILLDVGLFGYSVGVELCDDRHWNSDKGIWEEDI
jgi:hypothetical protein